MELLKSLIVVSEKAANIARVCRRDEHLFQLLVQKKNTVDSNPRFVEDFKTLADVLIQEMVRHDIGQRFSQLESNIQGEENNVFKNKLGEKICVEVMPTQDETSSLLEIVLNGDCIAANLLATEVHRDLNVKDVKTDLPQEEFNVDLTELGVWIDPIDCTAEYVHGGPGETVNNIHLNGLKCVTILIGVFNKITGEPIMGVVNRPFLDMEDLKYSQQCIWGVSLPDCKYSSTLGSISDKKIICISSSEEDDIKKKLKKCGFQLVKASGAGYKILAVILGPTASVISPKKGGLADAYLLTKGTTFKWDTCAPHAILKSVSGDIINYKLEVYSDETRSINYTKEESNCNSNGIIVYRSEKKLNEIVNILK